MLGVVEAAVVVTLVDNGAIESMPEEVEVAVTVVVVIVDIDVVFTEGAVVVGKPLVVDVVADADGSFISESSTVSLSSASLSLFADK